MHCLLILPLLVAICEIWPLRLTYGVYLVLSLKSDITCKPYLMVWYRHSRSEFLGVLELLASRSIMPFITWFSACVGARANPPYYLSFYSI